MDWNLLFICNSVLLGVGLAMDAFSVSLANGLAEPGMRRRKMCGIAGVFAAFQFAMPMIGWICVHTIVGYFQAFEKFIPWIVLALLGYIGGKMLYENIRFGEEQTESAEKTGIATLLLQGVATSIDALSVGFTIADYNSHMALVCKSRYFGRDDSDRDRIGDIYNRYHLKYSHFSLYNKAANMVKCYYSQPA